MLKKSKIEISKGVYDSLLDIYEKRKLSLVAINVNDVQGFIEYILKNSDASSKQFVNLTDQQKNAISNMHINNIVLNDLVITLPDSLGGDKKEEPK